MRSLGNVWLHDELENCILWIATGGIVPAFFAVMDFTRDFQIYSMSYLAFFLYSKPSKWYDISVCKHTNRQQKGMVK